MIEYDPAAGRGGSRLRTLSDVVSARLRVAGYTQWSPEIAYVVLWNQQVADRGTIDKYGNPIGAAPAI